MSPLICPVCRKVLVLSDRGATCAAGHHFDRAAQGYFNLLLQSSSRGHGDDKKMLLARRAFLDEGHYRPLLDALTDRILARFPDRGVFCDAGCGEGYYTHAILASLRNARKSPRGLSFDIARDAVKMTARKNTPQDLSFVASAYHVPLADASCDAILSVFSPYAEQEFLRLLRSGGYLYRAVGLEDHLFELKKAVYDRPVRTDKAAVIGDGFLLEEEAKIEGVMKLCSPESVRALFEMTPYAHKTSPADREKLLSLTHLETRFSFGVQVLRKKS